MIALTQEKRKKRGCSGDQALKLIAEGSTARGLLSKKNKTAVSRFNRHCASLDALMDEIRKDFPEAMYYSANGTVNLMIGESHDNEGNPQHDLSAESASGLYVEGGDW